MAGAIFEPTIPGKTPASGFGGRPGLTGWLILTVGAAAVGLLSGLIAASFRLLLQWSALFRAEGLDRAHDNGFPGFLGALLVPATMAAAAAWLVRRISPHAAGSGIPHVEAVVDGLLPPAPLRLLGVKYVGGLLAIGAGLALGREGPSVQMGANIGSLLGRWFRRSPEDSRAWLAAGAGAGLATAFNAPLAGGIFVLEELVRRFEPRMAIAALSASAVAIGVARAFLGTAAEFTVAHGNPPPFGGALLFMAFGLVAGGAGVAYQKLILGSLAVADRWRWIPVEARAAAVGALVGGVSWFAPDWVGGGDSITQSTLSGGIALRLLPWIFLFRFVLGPVCYAAGTPGGIFAPMLTVGAQVGVLFAALCPKALLLGVAPDTFAAVGMAAFFIGVVRAPLTGIVLVTELTGAGDLLLPMLAAGAGAMLIPAAAGISPIYDELKKRTLALETATRSRRDSPQPAKPVSPSSSASGTFTT